MKRNHYFRLLIIGFCTVFFLIGCAPEVLPASEEDIQTALAETLAAQPTETIAPTVAPTKTTAPTATAYQTSTPTPSPPLSGVIGADFLNLRAGPSTLFEVINTFIKDTTVTALERTQDNSWVRVEIEPEDEPAVDGWMAVDFLELEGEVSNLPLASIDEAQVIRGRVEDTDGTPIPGVVIAAVLQYDEVDLRTDVSSNTEGVFEVYLPEGLFGTFDIQIVAWLCESPVVNLDCNFSGYVQVIDRAFVTIPQEDEILFVYEKTELVVSGTVLDAKDEPVPQVNIRAVRDDGAFSFGRTDAVGEFSMPISAGIWEIFTVSFDPEYVEGEPISLEVTDSNPDEITLFAPK